MNEYFQLRDYLNRANKLSNQMTDVRFEIEHVRRLEYQLFAVSYGKNETHKIVIAERTSSKVWERAGSTRFHNLEEFCAQCMNDFETGKALPIRPRKLPDDLKDLLQREISSRLKMLLLKKSYEP